MATSPSLTVTVSANVEKAIEAAGSNPFKVSTGTGIALATLQRRLKGIESQSWKVNELEAIAAFLDVSVTDLIETKDAA